MSELIQALDQKAKEYMKRIIQDMVEWRKREAELIARLITRNSRRLQDRLKSYRMEPRRIWSPRGVVVGGPVELPEGEPYALYQRWPRPAGMEDMFIDTVRLFGANVQDSTVTKDSNIIYKEKVLVPGTDLGRTEELPKYPFFDNLQLSPAELIESIERYLAHVVLEVVLDREVEFTDCSLRVVGADYRYYCKPHNMSIVNLQPGEYQVSICTTVDFRAAHPHVANAVLQGFRFHGVYSGVNILYFTQDSTQYTISVDWYVYDGKYTQANIGGTTYDVPFGTRVVLAVVNNMNTPAQVKAVALHVGGSVFAARYQCTDQTSNTTSIAVAYDVRLRSGVDIVS